ncbi:MAG: methyltransferase domain-containing protein [Desulfovibrio sp.]|nr:methyltransferase domain-containing protein [Desulfovibrio sp.]
MDITREQRAQITGAIREKYEKVAAGLPGQFNYPTGVSGLAGLGYDNSWYAHLPKQVQECFCGVGNPFAMGIPGPGFRVIDVGCGCGVDTLIAASLVGPGGQAVGVESSSAMLAKAQDNARLAGVDNAIFLDGNAETLPLEDSSYDLVISSGVYNLVIDKAKALAEALRVLRPGGRLQIADQMLIGAAPMSAEDMVASWFT